MTTTLYRPVGLYELQKIRETKFRAFPPRLAHQPIFYPVLHEEYAVQIARDWNTKDSNSGYCGFVTAFDVNSEWLSNYEVKQVGGTMHREYWIPADKLGEFNSQINGTIRVIQAFYGEQYTGDKSELTPSVLETAVKRLEQDAGLFSKYWAGTHLEQSALHWHETPQKGKAHHEGHGRVMIVFIEAASCSCLEEAIVSAVKRHVYNSEDWTDSYMDETPAEEWEIYLRGYWMKEYFNNPTFQKYTLEKELDELQFDYSTVKTKEDIQSVFAKLLELLPGSAVVHFDDESFYCNYLIGYHPEKQVLFLYDWYLNC